MQTLRAKCQYVFLLLEEKLFKRRTRNSRSTARLSVVPAHILVTRAAFMLLPRLSKWVKNNANDEFGLFCSWAANQNFKHTWNYWMSSICNFYLHMLITSSFDVSVFVSLTLLCDGPEKPQSSVPTSVNGSVRLLMTKMSAWRKGSGFFYGFGTYLWWQEAMPSGQWSASTSGNDSREAAFNLPDRRN